MSPSSEVSSGHAVELLELFTRMLPALLNYAKHRLGNDADAHDATQETSLAVALQQKLLRLLGIVMLLICSRHRLGTDAQAKDATQETTLVVADSPKVLVDERKAKKKIWGIHRHKVLDVLRRRGRMGQILEPDLYPSEGPTPEKVAIQREELETRDRRTRTLLDRGLRLGQLSRRERRAFMLCDLPRRCDGCPRCTPAEAAERIGITRENVNVCRHRARQKLRPFLEKHYRDV
jgi:RNA polymerase sigma factor (sigma-70 family)